MTMLSYKAGSVSAKTVSASPLLSTAISKNTGVEIKNNSATPGEKALDTANTSVQVAQTDLVASVKTGISLNGDMKTAVPSPIYEKQMPTRTAFNGAFGEKLSANTSHSENISLPVQASLSTPKDVRISGDKVAVTNASFTQVNPSSTPSDVTLALGQSPGNPATQFVQSNNLFLAQLSQIQLLPNGTYKLNAALNPPELGKVEAELKMSNGVVSVTITSHNYNAHNNLSQNVHEIASLIQTDPSNINFRFSQGQGGGGQNPSKNSGGDQETESYDTSGAENSTTTQNTYAIGNSLHIVL